MTRARLAALALVLGLAGWPGAEGLAKPVVVASPAPKGSPAPLPSVDADAVEFLVGSQTLILHLPAGITPKLSLVRKPASLHVDVPVALAEGRAAFATGEVSSYAVAPIPGGSRVILMLHAPLRALPRLEYLAGRVVISVVPAKAPPVELVLPQPNASVYATPQPRPVPVPTASGPEGRIRPLPMPTGTGPLPTPRDIPPIHGGLPRREVRA